MKEINREFIDESVKVLDKADIELSQIPNINLYMEQLVDFINTNTSGYKRNEGNTFTKAMINNYTKAGLLNPPTNKKYNQEHIILLLLINHLKQVLSINDIKSLFAPILKNMDNI